MTPQLWSVLALLVLHFIGDFLGQSDEMAIRKSKSWAMLTLHVGIYTTAVAVGVLAMRGGIYTAPVVWFVAVTFATHFLTDAITSRVTSKLWFIDFYDRPKAWSREESAFVLKDYGAYPMFARVIPNRRHWFFVVIGLDQLIHGVTLIVTASWLGVL